MVRGLELSVWVESLFERSYSYIPLVLLAHESLLLVLHTAVRTDVYLVILNSLLPSYNMLYYLQYVYPPFLHPTASDSAHPAVVVVLNSYRYTRDHMVQLKELFKSGAPETT